MDGLFSVQLINDKTWLNVYNDATGSARLIQIVKPIEAEQYYTLSFKLKNNAISAQEIRMSFITLMLQLYDENDTFITTFSKNISIEDNLNEQEIVYTFETPNNANINYCKFILNAINFAPDPDPYVQSFKITNLQLEKGTVATNWIASQPDFYKKVEQYSQLVQTVHGLQSTVGEISTSTSTNTRNISTLQQTATSLTTTVATKVGENEVISKINQSSESVGINANKIVLSANDILNLLAGNTINLSGKHISIASNNFNVTSDGIVTILNGIINGGYINLKVTDQTRENAFLSIENEDSNYEKLEAFAHGIRITAEDGEAGINLNTGFEDEPGHINPRIQISDSSDGFTEISGNSVSTTHDMWAGEYHTYSLESIKKNFKKVDSVLSIIKNSEIYKYNLKREKDTDKRHYGFVIPDLGGDFKTPSEIIDKENKAIDQYSMISILWRAVQEQQEQIEKLEKLIK